MYIVTTRSRHITLRNDTTNHSKTEWQIRNSTSKKLAAVRRTGVVEIMGNLSLTSISVRMVSER